MTKSVFILIVLCVLLVNAQKKKDCVCFHTDELRPVCASDNKTYNNRGEVLCANKCEGKKLKILFFAPCRCACANTKEYRPVCASDNRSYVNKGAVRCHNQCYYNQIKLLRDGKCHENDIVLSN